MLLVYYHARLLFGSPLLHAFLMVLKLRNPPVIHGLFDLPVLLLDLARIVILVVVLHMSKESLVEELVDSAKEILQFRENDPNKCMLGGVLLLDGIQQMNMKEQMEIDAFLLVGAACKFGLYISLGEYIPGLLPQLLIVRQQQHQQFDKLSGLICDFLHLQIDLEGRLQQNGVDYYFVQLLPLLERQRFEDSSNSFEPEYPGVGFEYHCFNKLFEYPNPVGGVRKHYPEEAGHVHRVHYLYYAADVPGEFHRQFSVVHYHVVKELVDDQNQLPELFLAAALLEHPVYVAECFVLLYDSLRHIYYPPALAPVLHQLFDYLPQEVADFDNDGQLLLLGYLLLPHQLTHLLLQLIRVQYPGGLVIIKLIGNFG